MWDWVQGVGYPTDHDDACSINATRFSLGFYWTDLLAAVDTDRGHWSLLFVAPSSHAGSRLCTWAVVFLEKKKRRHIADVNISLCFPDLSDGQRADMVRRHFLAYGQGIVDL